MSSGPPGAESRLVTRSGNGRDNGGNTNGNGAKPPVRRTVQVPVGSPVAHTAPNRPFVLIGERITTFVGPERVTVYGHTPKGPVVVGEISIPEEYRR